MNGANEISRISRFSKTVSIATMLAQSENRGNLMIYYCRCNVAYGQCCRYGHPNLGYDAWLDCIWLAETGECGHTTRSLALALRLLMVREIESVHGKWKMNRFTEAITDSINCVLWRDMTSPYHGFSLDSPFRRSNGTATWMELRNKVKVRH